MARKKSVNPIKAIENRIEQLYYQRRSGIQINIMDIRKVFDAGKNAIVNNPGISDNDLGDAIFAFVQTIRKN